MSRLARVAALSLAHVLQRAAERATVLTDERGKPTFLHGVLVDATESELKRLALSEFQVVHFATHTLV